MAESITRRQIREAAAASLGLLTKVNVVGVNTDDHTVTVADLLTKFPDSFHVRDAWLTSRESDADGNSYNRVVEWFDQETPDTLKLDAGPQDLTTNEAAAIYFMLSPEDWNNVLNEALEKTLHVVRISITLDTDDNDYALSSQTDSDGELADWISSRTQVLRVDAKTTNGSIIIEEDWAGVRFIEDGNELTLRLTYIPQSADSLEITALKPYSRLGAELDEDSDTITAPFRLAVEAVKVQAMLLLYQRHGSDTMRRQFGASLAIAERELAKLKAQYVPAARPRSHQIDEHFSPDIPVDLLSPPW